MTMAAVVLLTALSCSGANDEASTGTVPKGFSAERCLVQVHGRSERGAPPMTTEEFAVLRPDANLPYDGGGRVWEYGTDDDYADALAQVIDVVDDTSCRSVVLHGFSNGAAFVGAVLCRGETLGGRLVGAVVDDPVPDDVHPCSPDRSVRIVVYWTGGLEGADPGRPCDELGWTCASDRLVGIEEYSRRLGVDVTPSVHTEHMVYEDAPQIHEWLANG